MHDRELAIKESSLVKENLNKEISTLRHELQMALEEVEILNFEKKKFFGKFELKKNKQKCEKYRGCFEIIVPFYMILGDMSAYALDFLNKKNVNNIWKQADNFFRQSEIEKKNE